MEENAKKKQGKIAQHALDFSIFRKFFQFFRKSYLLVLSHGNKNGDKNPDKNPYERAFGKSSKKPATKSEFRGIKDTVGKELPGFPNL